MSREGRSSGPVLLVVEQLRRRVPGGIGTYVRGLLNGLARLEEHGGRPVDLTLFASRAVPDPLVGFGNVPERGRLRPQRGLDRPLLRRHRKRCRLARCGRRLRVRAARGVAVSPDYAQARGRADLARSRGGAARAVSARSGRAI